MLHPKHYITALIWFILYRMSLLRFNYIARDCAAWITTWTQLIRGVVSNLPCGFDSSDPFRLSNLQLIGYGKKSAIVG